MRRTGAAVVGLAIAIGIGAAGCAGGKNSLGTGASACFRALPAARGVVHDKGRLVGVRRVSADTLRSHFPGDTAMATLPDQELCVFAFDGTYEPGSVTGAPNTTSGHFAIVVVGSKQPTVVAAAVVDDLPTRFRHLH
jgi:hypothetical protein